MPPPVNHEFAREDVFPSYWANALQRYLTAASAGIRLTRKSGTIVQVVPDATVGACGLAIEGRWRFNEATVERTHPGGAKGTYVVWAVAEDEDIDNAPDPFTDNTVYSFELRITSGAAPEGAGIDIVEKIGEIDWSGSAIERIRQTHGAVTGPLLGDGALSGSGDIDWTREASGAWVPQLKAGSVGTDELADGAVTSRKLKPTSGIVAATGALALTESFQDVPGAALEITPAVASILKVTAIFDLAALATSSGSPRSALGTMNVDGADESKTARMTVGFNSGTQAIETRGTVAQVYRIPLTAAAHTIKMRARRAEGTGGTIDHTRTQFLYELAAS